MEEELEEEQDLQAILTRQLTERWRWSSFWKRRYVLILEHTKDQVC